MGSARWLAVLMLSGCYASHAVEGGSADGGSVDAGGCAEERCDGRDDDCDGRVDEGDVCPCPAVQGEGTAYLFCDARRSWSDAQEACRAVGYDLVSIDDAAENALVYGEVAGRSFEAPWIGLREDGPGCRWVGVDGAEPDYTNWSVGEPNDMFGAEACAQMVTEFEEVESRWNDFPCDEAGPFVCERRE